MGEYADYMLNGDSCEGCGEYLGEGDGFPRRCAACRAEERLVAAAKPRCEPTTRNKPFKCVSCGKKLTTAQGLADHARVKHEIVK